MNPFTIFVLFIFSILIGYRANRLGRNFQIWMVGAMIFTPILAWIALEISGKKEEEKKKLIAKNKPNSELDNEIITPIDIVFESISNKETDLVDNRPSDLYIEETNTHYYKQEDEEKPSKTKETVNTLITNEQILTNEIKAPTSNKWFSKKMFAISINQTQKIIYGISVFLITLIMAYVLAEGIDSKMRISETWGVWIIFILIQAWFQNKLWNSYTTLNFVLYFPNVTRIFHSIKSSTYSHNKKHQTATVSSIIKSDNEKQILPFKKGQDKTTLIIYGLVALMFVLVIIAVVMKKVKPVEITKIVPSSDFSFVAKENEVIKSSEANNTDAKDPVVFNNETVSKLLKEFQDGQVNNYDFEDPSSLGFNFKSTFPESLNFFFKRKSECKAGLELTDSHGNIIKYTIVLNEGPVPDLTGSQLDEKLDAIPNTQIEQIYKLISKNYEMLSSPRKMFIGNFRAIRTDFLLENIDGSKIKYSAIRSYNFYFKGGNGQLSFWLHNNNKTQLKMDFKEYETLFQQIANSSELNIEQ